jgi:hypothetical protein
MTREVAHQKAFEKALYSIQPNFPPGKLPAEEKFASVYYNMSQGPGDERGPWNQGELWAAGVSSAVFLLSTGGATRARPCNGACAMLLSSSYLCAVARQAALAPSIASSRNLCFAPGV